MGLTSAVARNTLTLHTKPTRYLTSNQAAMGVKKQRGVGQEGRWPAPSGILGHGGQSLRDPFHPGAHSQNTANNLCRARPPARQGELYRTSTGERRRT